MKSTEQIERLIKKRRYKASTEAYEKTLNSFLQAVDNYEKQKLVLIQPNIWRVIVGSRAGSLAVSFLIISSLVACFVLSRKNADLRDELELARRDIAAAPIDDSVTINFYLREHQDTIARYASLNSATPQPVQMHISQDDIMYYEFLDDGPDSLRPGIIFRGPSSQRQISSSESPVVSNGHTLTLSEARETADFNLIAIPRLHPGYKLDQIRRIYGRDAMQLLYTNSISSVSLFEQPLNGQQKLSPQDFREYAVYRNKGQIGGAILTWRDNALTYVLIGNVEISQLMDMAQSISAGK